MKLYYSPSFTGFVYTNLSEIMFNEKIVDTKGLIDILNLFAGLSFKKKEKAERVLNYYKAMMAFMQKNPTNILKASFDIDGLRVAKECLFWRDNLTFAGWNKNTYCPSNRMEVLCGIEEYFSDKSIGDELVAITNSVKSNCLLPKEFEIETLIDYQLFSPLEVELLEALIERGVKVLTKKLPIKNKTALSSIIGILNSNDDKTIQIQKDDSFEILHFNDQDEACKYLSLQKPDLFDVWINSDNKVLDNWLNLEGKCLSGSIAKGVPQITQIFSIGLGIQKSPLNLKNLVEWLNIPISPIPYTVRKALERIIVKKGGYYNDDCKAIINDYINCENEYNELPENERKEKIKAENKERKDLIEKFLPNINEPANLNDDTIDINMVITFAGNLHKWCGKEINLISDDNQKIQLIMVRNECLAVISMLESETETRIGYQKLMSFVTFFEDNIEIIQYEAECGCRTVVSSPGQINSQVKKLIWCDFFNKPDEGLRYEFLLPNEKNEFKKNIKLWDEETERMYNRTINLLPLMLSERITLVVIDKILNEDTEKHPFFIQLEKKIENFDEFVKTPNINKEFENILIETETINNCLKPQDEGLIIKNSNLIKWQESESYSSFKQLIYYPFDYTFYYLAKISSLGRNALPDFFQTYGTVAHAIIEDIFNKNQNIKESGTVNYIKERITNNFDKVFMEKVNGYGALLLLKENILNLGSYKKQVYECVNRLLELIEKNKFHVLACEPWLENNDLVFANNIMIDGYIDMILADEEENLIVFDFKWAPRNQEKYIKRIKDNKSIQLELYKHLTKEIYGKKAKVVAYVILPEIIIISTEKFIGDNTYKVDLENLEELLPKIKNSYEYRLNQISNGFIEEATGLSKDLIKYQNDVNDKNLISLNFETKRYQKEANPYSKYSFFKARQ